MGLGEFVMSVGGETSNFIGFLGINAKFGGSPSLEDHQERYQVNKLSNIEERYSCRSFWHTANCGGLPKNKLKPCTTPQISHCHDFGKMIKSMANMDHMKKLRLLNLHHNCRKIHMMPFSDVHQS
jgi:hypothetical protein